MRIVPVISPSHLVTVDITCAILSLFAIAAHIYGRVRFFRQLLYSDYLLIISWLLFVPSQITADTLLGEYGFLDKRIVYPTYVYNAPPEYEKYISDKGAIEKGLKVFYIAIPFYHISLFCLKMVFLLTYRRLFPPSMTRLRITVNLTIALVVIGYMVSLGMLLFWCQPMSRNWTMNLKERCNSAIAFFPYVISTFFHIVTDIIIYILPFFLLPILATNNNLLTLRIIFSLGFFCILISVGRIIVNAMGVGSGPVSAFQSAEVSAAQILACLPMIKRSLQDCARGKAHVVSLWERSRIGGMKSEGSSTVRSGVTEAGAGSVRDDLA